MTKFEAKPDGIITLNKNSTNVKYHTYEKIAEVLNQQLKTINSLTGQVSELEEESMNIEQKALEMIQYYLQEYEKADSLISCVCNKNAADTLMEFLQVIGKDDMIKHVLRTGEIEVEEED